MVRHVALTVFEGPGLSISVAPEMIGTIGQIDARRLAPYAVLFSLPISGFGRPSRSPARGFFGRSSGGPMRMKRRAPTLLVCLGAMIELGACSGDTSDGPTHGGAGTNGG